MKRVILTDVDDVLLDWNNGFEAFMEKAGYPKIDGTDHHYSLAERHGVSELEAFKLAEEFNNSEEISQLQPFADSQEYVKKLQRNEGFTFIAITSLSDKQQAYDYRLANLQHHFGDAISELICLETGGPKKETLRRWENSNLFWIEDHYRNAIDGVSLGLRSVLIDRPYNQRLTDHDKLLYARVGPENPWKAIYHLVRMECIKDEVERYNA